MAAEMVIEEAHVGRLSRGGAVEGKHMPQKNAYIVAMV
jgi:hypothetical protein